MIPHLMIHADLNRLLNRPTLVILVVLFSSLLCYSQQESQAPLDDIKKFQKELNEEFKNADKSPLEKKERKKFKKHDFFEIDLKFRVEATLELRSATEFFSMKTTTDRLPEYRVYGQLHFTIDGNNFTLPVYQSKDLMKKLEYEDYLFFPFTDLTNGKTTYGGGRYIGLRIPKEGNKVIVDFNQAYNPYCAYSARYSCPIVPEENHLDIEVNAGVRYNEKKYH